VASSQPTPHSILVSRSPAPVFGGIALACIVAVPSTFLAARAHAPGKRFDRAAEVVGLLLIGWIGVELAFIRELSFFHPIYAAIGAAFVATGVADRKASRREVSRSSTPRR